MHHAASLRRMHTLWAYCLVHEVVLHCCVHTQVPIVLDADSVKGPLKEWVAGAAVANSIKASFRAFLESYASYAARVAFDRSKLVAPHAGRWRHASKSDLLCVSVDLRILVCQA